MNSNVGLLIITSPFLKFSLCSHGSVRMYSRGLPSLSLIVCGYNLRRWSNVGDGRRYYPVKVDEKLTKMCC